MKGNTSSGIQGLKLKLTKFVYLAPCAARVHGHNGQHKAMPDTTFPTSEDRYESWPRQIYNPDDGEISFLLFVSIEAAFPLLLTN